MIIGESISTKLAEKFFIMLVAGLGTALGKEIGKALWKYYIEPELKKQNEKKELFTVV